MRGAAGGSVRACGRFGGVLVGVRCGATGFSFSSAACACGCVLGCLCVLVVCLAVFFWGAAVRAVFADTGFSGSAGGVRAAGPLVLCT